MSVHRIRPAAIAHTLCPNGHRDAIEAIDPVIAKGELTRAYWSSAFDFCMECDEPITSADIEVLR